MSREEVMKEFQRGYDTLTWLMPEFAQLRGRLDVIVGQFREVSAVRTTKQAMVLRWRTEMVDRDMWMAASYRDMGDVKTRVKFASGCATWTMILTAFEAMNVAEFDEAMGVIVGIRDVPGLTNNAEF